MEYIAAQAVQVENPEVTITRLARAKALDHQAQKLRDELHERWYTFAQILHPIWEEHLYIELGYKNWTDYIEATLRLPVTTVSNWLLPYRKLLQSGLDPEQVKDVPLNRTSDLAALARANDGKLDPELIEQAKTAKTRDEVQSYREVIDHEKQRLGIEPIKQIKLIVNDSLYDLYREVTKLVAKLDDSEVEKRHEVLMLEMALVALLDTPEIKELLEEER